jgi:hypothetical protein
MEQRINVNLTLSRANASALLESLDRQLKILHDVEDHSVLEVSTKVKREKDAIAALLIALECALKTPPKQ